nr:MAG TPA: hypothetical protein [Caudoviricetes sp.]
MSGQSPLVNPLPNINRFHRHHKPVSPGCRQGFTSILYRHRDMLSRHVFSLTPCVN